MFLIYAAHILFETANMNKKSLMDSWADSVQWLLPLCILLYAILAHIS
jgi:hypothetical protein